MANFIPAASYRFLTPLYDGLAAVLGAGPRFKRRVAAAANLDQGSRRILDLGCGTGLLVHALRQQYPSSRVTGLDIDRDILSLARRQLQQRVAGTGVLVCGSADALPFADATMDAALSTLMLHHLPPDLKQRAVREVGRVLKPAAVFYVVDMGPARSRTLTPEEMGSFKWAYRSNTADTLLEMLLAAGFDVRREPPPRSGLLAAWIFAIRATKRC